MFKMHFIKSCCDMNVLIRSLKLNFFYEQSLQETTKHKYYFMRFYFSLIRFTLYSFSKRWTVSEQQRIVGSAQWKINAHKIRKFMVALSLSQKKGGKRESNIGFCTMFYTAHSRVVVQCTEIEWDIQHWNFYSILLWTCIRKIMVVFWIPFALCL